MALFLRQVYSIMAMWIIRLLALSFETLAVVRYTSDLIRAPWEKGSTILIYMPIVRHIPISERFKELEKKTVSQ